MHIVGWADYPLRSRLPVAKRNCNRWMSSTVAQARAAVAAICVPWLKTRRLPTTNQPFASLAAQTNVQIWTIDDESNGDGKLTWDDIWAYAHKVHGDKRYSRHLFACLSFAQRCSK